VSAKGDHADSWECFEWLIRKGVEVNILTLCPKSELAIRAQRLGGRVSITYPEVQFTSPHDGFIPVVPSLALATQVRALHSSANQDPPQGHEDLFAQAKRDDERDFSTVQLRRGEHLTVVCTKWAQAAALDIQTRITESGLIPPLICDPWNFAHGRYMPVAAGRSRLIALGTQRDSVGLREILDVIPLSAVITTIIAPDDGFIGGLYCLIRAMLVVGRITSFYGIDPATPSMPEWGTALYKRARIR